MATAEQINAMMAQLQQLTAAMFEQAQVQVQQTVGMAATLPVDPAAGRNKKIIDPRFIKLPFFDGTPTKFDDWAFGFKRTIRAANRDVYDVLAKVELETDVGEDRMDAEFQGLSTSGISAEMYDLLCQACSGEAMTCIRSVDDMRGLTAWAKLYKKFNPKTMARAIRLVGAVTHPVKIQDLNHVEACLDKREEHVKSLLKDFSKRSSPIP